MSVYWKWVIAIVAFIAIASSGCVDPDSAPSTGEVLRDSIEHAESYCEHWEDNSRQYARCVQENLP